MHLHDTYKDVEDFFASPPSANEKAWGIIHDFYHMILTHMEKQGISKSDLAKRLGKSRSAITQMINKTPNITLKKMVEIADAIGVDIRISSPQVHVSGTDTPSPIVYHLSTHETSPPIPDDALSRWNIGQSLAWTIRTKKQEQYGQ
jgi:transcriptional regulator with XRE-family HTH domain